MRVASFAVTGKDGLNADISIVPLPGQAGTELDNVNRWRGELDLPPVTMAELESQAVEVCDVEGRLFDLVSESPRIAGKYKERTLAALAEHGGQTWFFKMRGEADLVAGEKQRFIAFLKSIDFHHNHEEAASPSVTAKPAAPVDSPKPAAGSPQWTIPAGWNPESPGPMVQLAFGVSGGQEEAAKVTVSSFPGDVGGVLANVNRWRGQVGLEPVEASGLAQVTSKLDLATGGAIVADMTGQDPRTGKPARMVAVIAPQGERTWFYKFLGDVAVVGTQKDAFLGFVKSAKYPQ